MQLFIRSKSGHMRVVDIDKSAKIETIVSHISENKDSGVFRRDLDDTYLSYGGVPLRVERTLEDYGIQDHSTLECRVRTRGGCFVFSVTLWIIIFSCFLLSICTCGLTLPVALALIPLALLLPLCCL